MEPKQWWYPPVLRFALGFSMKQYHGEFPGNPAPRKWHRLADLCPGVASSDSPPASSSLWSSDGVELLTLLLGESKTIIPAFQDHTCMYYMYTHMYVCIYIYIHIHVYVIIPAEISRFSLTMVIFGETVKPWISSRRDAGWSPHPGTSPLQDVSHPAIASYVEKSRERE